MVRLLLKTPHYLSHRTRKNEAATSLKVHPYWLAFTVPNGLCMLQGEKRSQQAYSPEKPEKSYDSNQLARVGLLAQS